MKELVVRSNCTFCIIIKKYLASIIISFVLMQVSEASVSIFTDSTSWKNEVGDYSEETFSDSTLNSDINVNTDNGYISSSDGKWYDQVIPGEAVTIWSFSNPIVGFGANWDLAGPGGPGTNIRLYLNGSFVGAEILSNYNGNFFGMVSTSPFNQVLVTAGSNTSGWCERYTMDNMVYVKAQTPWSFVQITDLHIGRKGADEMLNDAVDFLNNVSPKPDFVLVTGDIADSAWNEILAIPTPFKSGSYKRYLEIMNQLDNNIKHYEIPGNHDRYVNVYDGLVHFYSGIRGIPYSRDLSQYRLYLPIGPGYFSFYHKGLIFIGLDSGQDTENGIIGTGTYHQGTGLTNDQIDWLETNNSSEHKIIFMHHPIINYPVNEWTIPSYQQYYFINDYCKNNNVSTVISGHTHKSVINEKYGTQYVQTDAMKDGYLRFYNVLGNNVQPEETMFVSYQSTITTSLSSLAIVQPEETMFVSYQSTITTSLPSPVNIHVYDSSGSHVGIDTSGSVENHIPRSYYLSNIHEEIDNKIVTLFPEKIKIYEASDDYIYKVVGNENSTYELNINFINNEEILFAAIDIPTSPGEIHQYEIDWEALTKGQEGVVIKIDSDGDGTFEKTVYANSDLTSQEYALQTETVIDFNPDTLNISSSGKYVTVYIELPEGSDISEIDVSSVQLNNSVSALSKPVGIGDYDNDEIPDLMVKFDREEVIKILNSGENTIEITGRLNDETLFSGSDTIEVKNSKNDKITH